MTLGPAHTLQEAIRLFNPQRALEGESLAAFYAERGSDARQKMRDLLELAEGEPVRLLFTGHGGSGKSTELNKLTEELGDRFFVVKVSTGQIIPPTDLTFVDVVLIAAMALFKQATDENVIRKAPAQIVEGVWGQVTHLIDQVIFGMAPYRKPITTPEVGIKIGLPGVVQGLAVEFEARYKNDINTRQSVRQQMQNRLSEVIGSMNLLSYEIQHRYRRTVLLVVEDTDKPDPARAADIFFEHPQSLTDFGASVIYTFPIALRYSPRFSEIDRYFRDFRMPNLSLRWRDETPNPEARRVMDLAIARRMQSVLIDPDARARLIDASGGLMRNLIDLVQYSALNAYGRRADRIQAADTERAIAELRKDFEAALAADDRYYDFLIARMADKQLAGGALLQELLQMRALLEYENGDVWCDVHPVAQPLVEARARKRPAA